MRIASAAAATISARARDARVRAVAEAPRQERAARSRQTESRGARAARRPQDARPVRSVASGPGSEWQTRWSRTDRVPALLHRHHGRLRARRDHAAAASGRDTQEEARERRERPAGGLLQAGRRTRDQFGAASFQDRADAETDPDPLRERHRLPADLPRRAQTGRRPVAALDGLLDGPLGRRHPRGRHRRVQRPPFGSTRSGIRTRRRCT